MLGRRTFAIKKELLRSQWFSAEEMESLRLGRLQQTIRLAYDHTSYWREVMDAAGIDPDSIEDISDLRRFPLLAKPTLRSSREAMAWKEAAKRVQLVRTSGSTNEALQFYTSSNREAHITAARMRGHYWAGVRKGHREMYFWGSPVELSKQDKVKRLRDRMINDGLTDGFRVTAELTPGYFEHWMKWRPRVIFGYPSSFVLLVGFAAKRGLDLSLLKQRGLRVICTTSEMLTEPDREMIERAFGVPVRDSYGVREGGLIGYECEEGRMHTMDEQVILETIDPVTGESTDGEGELVLTNIVGRVMPVIRYRTGDIVTLNREPCACGRRLGTIDISGGRAVDFVLTGKGEWIAGYAFIYICRSVPGIVKFQVRQKEKGRLRVLLATDEKFPADGRERVREAVLKRLESDDEIIVEQVDDIEPAPSGKYRPVVSEIPRGV